MQDYTFNEANAMWFKKLLLDIPIDKIGPGSRYILVQMLNQFNHDMHEEFKGFFIKIY